MPYFICWLMLYLVAYTCMGKKTIKESEIMLLKTVLNLSNKRIGEILDISEEEVKKIVNKHNG